MSTDNALATVTALGPVAAAPEAMLMPAHVAAVVPFQDHDRFARLSFDQQKRVSLLLKIFRDMATDSEGIVAASDRMIASYPGQGFSGPNLRTLYYKFKKRGWTALAKIYN